MTTTTPAPALVIPAKAGIHLPPHPEAQGRGNAQ
ncbi:hypothetical protein FHS93_000968 [Sphingobium francense]|nr:hypothetical protein [Sphingobium indicum]